MRQPKNLVADIKPFILKFEIENLYVFHELNVITSLISTDPDYFKRLHRFNKRYIKSKLKEF